MVASADLWLAKKNPFLGRVSAYALTITAGDYTYTFLVGAR